MKKWSITLAIAMMLFLSHASMAQPVKVKRSDFLSLSGNWKGTLTYLDYSSGKPYTMPAEVSIKPLKGTNAYSFYNSYPDEPKANSTDTVFITAKRTIIDEAPVTGRRKLDDGLIEIVTERMGKDGNDNNPAVIRITYTIGKNSFTNVKDVQFAGQTGWIKRHEYSYTRN